MKSTQTTKIRSFLTAFKDKVVNNQYFESFTFIFNSGYREIPGSLNINDDGFVIDFIGKHSFPSYEDSIGYIVENGVKYDKLTVVISERGKRTILTAEDKDVKIKHENKPVEENLKNVPVLKNKKYNINISKAHDLLLELGYITEDGKLRNDKIRKFNQTDTFIDFIEDLFPNKKYLNIVDCACGKSYLSFILNYWLWEQRQTKAHFYCIDISEKVIAKSRSMAEKLGYTNMSFFTEDLINLKKEDISLERNPDAVISLHACDTATDMAIGFGIRNNAQSIICVPCCHKELLNRFSNNNIDNLITEGVLRSRFNSILTDSLRVLKLRSEGYDTQIVEFCSPIDTPKNLLIKAKKTGNKDMQAEERYQQVLRDFKIYPSLEIFSRNELKL